jgi:hypothetical protein
LSATAASFVAAAGINQKEDAALGVIAAVSKLNPSALPSVVGAVAKAEPRLAGKIATAAAKLQPKLSQDIQLAAAASHVPVIVSPQKTNGHAVAIDVGPPAKSQGRGKKVGHYRNSVPPGPADHLDSSVAAPQPSIPQP